MNSLCPAVKGNVLKCKNCHSCNAPPSTLKKHDCQDECCSPLVSTKCLIDKYDNETFNSYTNFNQGVFIFSFTNDLLSGQHQAKQT